MLTGRPLTSISVEVSKQAELVSHVYLGERHSSHPTVEGDSHSLSDPVVFDWSIKAGLHSFRRSGGHHELTIFCNNLFVCNLQNQGFYLLGDLLLDGRKMEFLQMIAEDLNVYLKGSEGDLSTEGNSTHQLLIQYKQ